MIPIIQAYHYEKMDDFIHSINYGGELYNVFEKGKFVFRGHASDKYVLTPSALRPEAKDWFCRLAISGSGKEDIEWFQMSNEYNLLRRFYKVCDRRGLNIPNISRIRRTFHDEIDINTMLTNENWLPQMTGGQVPRHVTWFMYPKYAELGRALNQSVAEVA